MPSVAFSPLGIKTVFEAINTFDMPDFIIDSGEKMLTVMQEINHPDLLMQYDIYHILMMQENPASFIQQYTDKIDHIQFADCPGRINWGLAIWVLRRYFRLSKSLLIKAELVQNIYR